jgi:hypothetical protein
MAMGRQSAGLARLILTVVLAAGAVGCSTGGSSSTSEVASDAACAQFRRVVTDTAAGRLTESDLRAEFEEILEAAREAGTSAMADASQRVASSLTAGDMIAFEQAFRDMDAACSEAGL